MSKTVKNIVTASVLAASCLAAGQAMAGVTGNIGVTSNYIWRGETQNADESAISGGLDYAHDSGVYVGTWISSLGGSNEYEQDLYGGYTHSFGDLGLDVGMIRYGYPKVGNNSDFNEVYVGGSYGMFSAKYSYSDDYLGYSHTSHTGTKKSAYYLEAAVAIPLKKDVSLGLHYGMKGGDYFSKNAVGHDGYGDYSVSLSKGDFTVSYSNTDNKKVGQTDNYRMAVSWSKSFDL